MATVVTPEPICSEAAPLVVALPPLETRRVSLKESAKSTRADLKPVVLTLAMLLPMTSISSWKFWRPLMAEVSARSMLLWSWGLVCLGRGRRDCRYLVQAVGLAVDHDLGHPCLHLHGADEATRRRAVIS